MSNQSQYPSQGAYRTRGYVRRVTKSQFNAGVLTQTNLLTLCRPLQTEDWFQELRDCHTVLDRDRILPVKPKKLVKVAVLDTGVDLTNPKLQKLQRDGLLDDGIDLVDGGKMITDRDGHGTHVCHTLHQTAPWAKLYPIRVFRKREADSLTASLVVEV
jgi:hypothetical protein